MRGIRRRGRGFGLQMQVVTAGVWDTLLLIGDAGHWLIRRSGGLVVISMAG